MSSHRSLFNRNSLVTDPVHRSLFNRNGLFADQIFDSHDLQIGVQQQLQAEDGYFSEGLAHEVVVL